MLLLLFVLHLEPEDELFESVGVGRERTLQS
jgi:hypothetical protein